MAKISKQNKYFCRKLYLQIRNVPLMINRMLIICLSWKLKPTRCTSAYRDLWVSRLAVTRRRDQSRSSLTSKYYLYPGVCIQNHVTNYLSLSHLISDFESFRFSKLWVEHVDDHYDTPGKQIWVIGQYCNSMNVVSVYVCECVYFFLLSDLTIGAFSHKMSHFITL